MKENKSFNGRGFKGEKTEEKGKYGKTEVKGKYGKPEGKGKYAKAETRNRSGKVEFKGRNAEVDSKYKIEKPEVKGVAQDKPVREDLIEGRNAVIEALKSDRTIESILIAKGDTEGSITVVLALAKEKDIVIKEVDRKKLDQMSETGSHQGVIALITPYKYFDVKDIFDYAASRDEKPFIIILDEIEDPHNFGAIIRTAEVCGVHGIIIPKRRNVGVTPIVYKSSAGAVENMRIAKVTNINATIDEIKKQGVWIYGADMDGAQYCFDVDLQGSLALVIGSEGRGISKLTKEKCDVLVKIPMVGTITSLNASVAGGIIIYEILKQRIKRG